MPERHFILPEGASGEGISKGNIVPLGPPVGVRDPLRRGPGFLLLFSIKSKEERPCFAEKVPNGRTTYLHQEIFCANALYICRFRLVGKGLERETLLPFPRLRRFGTHSETGSKFLLLFSIKSKEESPCFAETVLNWRSTDVAQAKLLRDCAIFSLARMRPFKLPSSSTLSAFSANPPTAPSLAPHPPAAQPPRDA